MKTLVMTLVMVTTGMANVVADNATQRFAYNQVMDGGQVKSEMVYKVEDGKYLTQHLQYNFTYDEQGRVTGKEALKWNEINNAYERYYCLNLNYEGESVNMQYALWNDESGAYTDIKSKAVYETSMDGANYQCYNWDAEAGNWDLQLEHRVGEEVRLYAGK